jgi:hypothetical protein
VQAFSVGAAAARKFGQSIANIASTNKSRPDIPRNIHRNQRNAGRRARKCDRRGLAIYVVQLYLTFRTWNNM